MDSSSYILLYPISVAIFFGILAVYTIYKPKLKKLKFTIAVTLRNFWIATNSANIQWLNDVNKQQIIETIYDGRIRGISHIGNYHGTREDARNILDDVINSMKKSSKDFYGGFIFERKINQYDTAVSNKIEKYIRDILNQQKMRKVIKTCKRINFINLLLFLCSTIIFVLLLFDIIKIVINNQVLVEQCAITAVYFMALIFLIQIVLLILLAIMIYRENGIEEGVETDATQI